MLSPPDLQFLSDHTRATIDASRVLPYQSVARSVRNTTGQTLIRPGGRDCYPAFWVRDFAMSLDSRFIKSDETLHALKLIAKTQNGPTPRRLKSGALIPAGSIPDHILFDGSPVFYPGTMSPADDQGGEPFGTLPPADDHYEFIHIAHWLLSSTRNPSFLLEKINDVPILERMIKAFDVPTADPSTGGMFSTPANERAVGFGFYDIVHLTGSVLFPSLLRHRAALELADLLTAANQPGADQYQQIAASIRSHLVPIFSDSDKKHGWLLAATDIGRQPDVWSTLYALRLDLLPDDFAARARATIADAVTRNTITSQAAVRHIPTDHDFSRESAWQKTAPGIPINTYQNGAYWHTPTGWLIWALAKSHPDLAQQIARDYITHLRRHDFRQGPQHGAPFECFTQDVAAPQNPVYMTSVAVPLSVLRS
jgi:hypothetical protein